MTTLDVDLLKENNVTLQNFFANNRIIALFDIADGCRDKFSEPFIIYNKNLLYSKFFTTVSVKGNQSFSIYITSSLLNKGNVIKVLDNYFVYDGSEFIKSEKPDLLRPYMEGLFGFRKIRLGTNIVPIEVCYPTVISAHDAHYHLVREKENTIVHIVAELPSRYSIEQYFNNLTDIGKKIMPLSLMVEVSLSSTVRKAVR